MKNFGNYLKKIRHNAGYRSLEQVLETLNKEKVGSEIKLSKSMLSLYERGEVKNVNPETLKLLSKIYKVNFETLAKNWFSERFTINTFDSGNDKSFVSNIKENEISFKNPTEKEEDNMKIISLECFQEKQANLPSKSQVGISAPIFLDDSIFFDTVTKNIQRKVNYFYLLPDEQYLAYKVFISRIIKENPKLDNKVDGKLTHFINNTNLHTPLNTVVYIYPNGKIEAFIGLSFDHQPHYFQVADLPLTWRLYDSFQWSILLAKDKMISKRILELKLETSLSSFDKTNRDFKSFI